MPSASSPYFVVLSGLVGALSGALITWLVGRRTAKISRTVELFKEFNSSALGTSRIEAHRFIRENPVNSFEEYSTIHDAKPLWEIVYFYQRLMQMRDQNLLFDHVIPDWFGETFVWWYEYSFKYELKPASWRAFKDVDKLYNWLCSAVGKKENFPLYIPCNVYRITSISQSDWDHWHERGRNSRIKDKGTA